MENKKIAAQQAQPAPKAPAEVKAEPQKAPSPTKAVAGMWQIQLMSSPNKQAVEKAWVNLSKKYKKLTLSMYLLTLLFFVKFLI